MSKLGDQRENMRDSTNILTRADGSWDITFPNGRHLRDQAATQQAALEAAREAYNAWIVGQWQKGEMIHGDAIGQRWLSPLK